MTEPVGLFGTLIERWREDNNAIHRKYTDAGVAVLKCADELEAALATLPHDCACCGQPIGAPELCESCLRAGVPDPTNPAALPQAPPVARPTEQR